MSIAFLLRHAALPLCACVLSWPAQAQDLSLQEAQALAVATAPQLHAQQAAIRAAQAAVGPASELPDPRLVAGVENLPVDGGDRFSLTRDFMTMRKIGVMQDFPRGEKRRLKGERAQAEARREEAMLASIAAKARRDAGVAWVDAWSAQEQLKLIAELEKEARLQVTAAEATLAGGRGSTAEPFAARLSLEQLGDRVIESRRLETRAREQLARWIGRHADRPLSAAPDLSRLTHDHATLVNRIESHPELLVYEPLQAIADLDVKLAEAAKTPDWSLEVAYAQRGPAYSNMLNIGVRVDLPIFEGRRQEPMIASKLAAAEQVRSQTEDARRMHLAEVRVFLTDWRAALERLEKFDKRQLPLAEERVKSALAGYSGGRSDLAQLLEAQRSRLDVAMTRLMAQTDAARAWVQLASLVPTGNWEGGRP